MIGDVVAAYSTRELQHVRRVCEAEALALCDAGVTSHAVLGLIELATACGAELLERNALDPLPPYFDTCVVDGARLTFQIRVF